MKLYDIKVAIPGPKTKEIVEKDKKYLATGTKTSPVAISFGKGMTFQDLDGNTLLDFTNGMVGATGHCHPKVISAIKEQLDKFLFFNGPDFYYPIQSELAQKLTEITPGNFDKKVFFSNSGTEGIEAAIKIARWSTKRKQFISFIGAFHGRTLGSLSLTGSKVVHKNNFFPTMPGVTHIPYAYCYRCAYKMEYPSCDIWCAKILEDLYFRTILPPEEVAAIFVEPVQGEGGYVVPPKEFIEELKKIASKYEILLVDDEVQAGIGRTGKMFAIENFDVEPDIVVSAKAIASGIPMGATIFNAKYDFGVEGAHSNTYGGNPVSCAAALATIDVIYSENLLENSKIMGDYMKQSLLKLQEKYECIGDVRGIGLMLATEFVEDRKSKKFAKNLRDAILENTYKLGLLLLPCGVSGIRYSPALILNKEHIDSAIEILDESIKRALITKK